MSLIEKGVVCLVGIGGEGVLTSRLDEDRDGAEAPLLVLSSASDADGGVGDLTLGKRRETVGGSAGGVVVLVLKLDTGTLTEVLASV